MLTRPAMDADIELYITREVDRILNGYIRRCACGCGNPVSMAKRTNKRYGHIKGKPVRFISGHNRDQTVKHGFCRKQFRSEWHAFYGARDRCNNPKNINYRNYGGRGIRFLFTSYEQFFLYLGPRPAGHSLERKNNDGPYAPFNSVWASKEVQTKNKRNNNQYQHFDLTYLPENGFDENPFNQLPY